MAGPTSEDCGWGWSETGRIEIPIVSVLVIAEKSIERGYLQRVQRGGVVLHSEMDCLEYAGLKAADYKKSVPYTDSLWLLTLSTRIRLFVCGSPKAGVNRKDLPYTPAC
jgi:tRNA(Arg) A34 adenosine deaminase TadA